MADSKAFTLSDRIADWARPVFHEDTVLLRGESVNTFTLAQLAALDLFLDLEKDQLYEGLIRNGLPEDTALHIDSYQSEGETLIGLYTRHVYERDVCRALDSFVTELVALMEAEARKLRT